MPKAKSWVPPTSAAERRTNFTVNILTTVPPTPTEGTNEKGFECPLCVDDFKKFSQLKWHLLAMHPRREMIMKMVKERHGISSKDQNATVDSQHAQQQPSTSRTQTVKKLQPVVAAAKSL